MDSFNDLDIRYVYDPTADQRSSDSYRSDAYITVGETTIVVKNTWAYWGSDRNENGEWQRVWSGLKEERFEFVAVGEPDIA